MLLGIDHLVIAVPDPDAAAAELEVALGLAATGGGRHDVGTRNRLVFLGDAYLELIGVWDPALAAAHPIAAATERLLGAGAEGLATYALATDGARRAVKGLWAAGSPISAPVSGSRTRPDGQVVGWRCLFPPSLGPDRPPFLIEHEMTGPEWGPEARRERAAFVHPFGGAARLIGLEIEVADPVAVAEAYRREVGVSLLPGPGPVPGAREARIGEQVIRLVPPRPGGAGGGSRGAADPGAVPPVRVGIAGAAGRHVMADLFGIRFARL